VNDCCTDSTLASAAVYGDHTWEAYSSSGLTYVMNALSKVYRSLEWKHWKIKLAVITLSCKKKNGSYKSNAETARKENTRLESETQKCSGGKCRIGYLHGIGTTADLL